jgi:hypothetical protein
MIDFRLNNRVSVPGKGRDFYLVHCVQISDLGLTPLLSDDIGGLLPEAKAAGTPS